MNFKIEFIPAATKYTVLLRQTYNEFLVDEKCKMVYVNVKCIHDTLSTSMYLYSPVVVVVCCVLHGKLNMHIMHVVIPCGNPWTKSLPSSKRQQASDHCAALPASRGWASDHCAALLASRGWASDHCAALPAFRGQ